MKGWRVMREQLAQQIAALNAEEAGARDALSKAFEELKKFEHVAEVARLAEAKELARRESAALDEMGLRKATGR
jgi:flagellar FliJ protein